MNALERWAKLAKIENALARKTWQASPPEPPKASPMKRRNAVNVKPKIREEIVNRFNSGQGENTIAAKMRVSLHSVRITLSEEGLKPFPKRDLPRTALKIHDRLVDGFTHQKIAEEIGISRQAVSDYVKRYGLTLW